MARDIVLVPESVMKTSDDDSRVTDDDWRSRATDDDWRSRATDDYWRSCATDKRLGLSVRFDHLSPAFSEDTHK